MNSARKYRHLSLFISSIFFLLMACKKGDNNNDQPVYMPQAPPTHADSPVKKYLALGDSYTIGQNVMPSDRFPQQAVSTLILQNKLIDPPVYVATTGWTTGNLLNALDATVYAKDYDIVTLLIGVNNEYQGRSLAEYKTQFTTLLGRAIEYANNKKNHVFVLSIPDYSVTPFASGSDTARISKEIDDFNLANKTITDSIGVTYIDITPISRKARTDQTLTASDGLHPSGKQYGLWVELLAPLMKAVL